MQVYVVRTWPLRGRSRFVCWNITGVQRAFRAKYAKVFFSPLPCDLIDLRARITAAVKNIDTPMLTHVWQELEYRIDVCRVTRGAHIEHL